MLTNRMGLELAIVEIRCQTSIGALIGNTYIVGHSTASLRKSNNFHYQRSLSKYTLIYLITIVEHFVGNPTSSSESS